MSKMYFKKAGDLVEVLSVVDNQVEFIWENMMLTRNIDDFLPLDAVFCCPNCGSLDVENLAWVKTNTNKYTSELEDYDHDTYCPDCETHNFEFTMYTDYLESKK